VSGRCQDAVAEGIRGGNTYVVVELAPRYGDVVARVRGVQEAVVVVLVAREAVCGEITVINPDLCRVIERHQVSTLRGIVELEVPQNDVADLLHAESAPGKTWYIAPLLAFRSQ
jgi:hypothetical protein